MKSESVACQREVGPCHAKQKEMSVKRHLATKKGLGRKVNQLRGAFDIHDVAKELE
ncbi:hypothetical protein ARMGADRAFT_137807 [Armillaria gallica]|uniref:Uncharacterized protein n=1 Tax=Armillaria gallica TaxID=47427 RepID=A0A2H3DC53_ARMGA|nr:hypothetical protein ARMGADRAFT_137807 [Armillaria gallica]